jgi:D-alanine transaminase
MVLRGMNLPSRCAPELVGAIWLPQTIPQPLEQDVLVYLNGDLVPAAEARVSVDDRGFLFADGLYEVARVYGGRPYELDEHLARMARGLEALQIAVDDLAGVRTTALRLLEENEVRDDGVIYIQITRGAAPRAHHFPADTPPTVYIAARPYSPYPAGHWEDGVEAITIPDTRWPRCDIKSIALLPNVLANQAAHEAGAFEAIFVRDGVITEGSHSNVWGVRDGALLTYPACNYILSGITRDRVFELAAELGIEAREEPVRIEEITDLDEIFLSGTTTEIMPVTRVDGQDVVDAEPGPVTRKLFEAFRAALPGR